MGKIDTNTIGGNANTLATSSLSGTLTKAVLGGQGGGLDVAVASAARPSTVSTATRVVSTGKAGSLGDPALTLASPLDGKSAGGGTTTTTTTSGGGKVGKSATAATPVTDVVIAATVDAAFMATLPVGIQPAINQLTSLGTEWAYKNAAGQVVVNYSFMSSAPTEYGGTGEATGFSAFTEAQKMAARAMLANWAEVANLTFAEVTGNTGSIRFGNTTTGPQVAWAYGPATGKGGDVWINPSYSYNQTLSLGSYGLHTMVHEIGHALGLDHAGDYNGTTAPTGPTHTYDTRQYSIMSYYNGANFGGIYSAEPALHDIAAIQALYGANTATRAGDNVYTWTPGSNVAIETIWDAGGWDILDLRGQTTRVILDLNEGGFSSIGLNGYNQLAVDNVAIAYGAQIEGAHGGEGNDTLIGNGLDNELFGNGGDDTLTGGAGNDLLWGGAGNDLLSGGTGDDMYIYTAGWGVETINDLSGISKILFNDVVRSALTLTKVGTSLEIASGSDLLTVTNYVGNEGNFIFCANDGYFQPVFVNGAPVVTATSLAGRDLSEGSQLALNSLFSVSDAEGDTITQYRVRDVSTSADSGFLAKDGVAYVQGEWVTMNAADFASAYYQSPGSATSDTVEVQAFDGSSWSAVASQTLNTVHVNRIPTVTANYTEYRMEAGSVALSTLFTIDDAEGDAITQYRMRDTTAASNSGYILGPRYGFSYQTSWQTYTAAEFAQAVYQAGSVNGSESIELQVFDGTSWSAVASQKISTEADGLAKGAIALGALPSSGFAVSGTLNGGFDTRDFYTFTLSQNTVVDIGVTGLTANADLRLYRTQAGASNQVVLADSANPGTASEAMTMTLAAGTYAVRVGGYAATDYSLAIGQSAAPAGNDVPVVVSSASPYDLWAGQTVALDRIFAASDAESGMFMTKMRVRDLTAGGAELQARSGTVSADGWLELSNWTLSNCSVTAGADGAEDRFEVQAYDGTAWSASTVQTVRSHGTAYADILADATDLGTLSHADMFVKGVINGTDGARYYKFTMSRQNDISFSVSGMDTAVRAEILDASGNLLRSMTTGWSSSGQSGSVDATAGDYYLRIEAWDMGTPFSVRLVDNTDPIMRATPIGVQAVNTSISLSSLFTFTDPDGEADFSLCVYDEVGGGYLTRNGARLAEASALWFSSSDIGQFAYVTAAGDATERIVLGAQERYNGWGVATATVSTSTAMVAAASQSTSAAWIDQTGLGAAAAASAAILPSDQTLQNGLLAAA